MHKIKFPEFLRLVSLWGTPQIWIFAPWVLSTVHQSGFLKWPISLIRSGKKQSISNFSSFLFDKTYKNSTKLYENSSKLYEKLTNIHEKLTKIHSSCFSPTSYQKRRHMGQFKNPIWCTVDETLGAKLQIWGVPHKLTSLRNSGNFLLSIYMHRVQRYDSVKSCSCCLNTL